MDLKKFNETIESIETAFPLRLDELIKETGKTLTKINSDLKCANSTVNHYLDGRYLPTFEMTIKLADYFNCTADYLLGLKNDCNITKFKICPPFSEQLKFLCDDAGITRYKLSSEIKVSKSVIQYWWNGKNNPTIISVVKLAQYFDCSVDFILGREY